MTQFSTDGPTLDLRFLQTTIRVTSANPAPLTWLAEFLTPEFETVSDAAPDIAVHFDDAGATYDELVGLGPLAGADVVPGFALDTKTVALTPWQRRAGASASAVFREPDHGVFYELSADCRNIAVVARANKIWTRVALLRIVREFAQSRAMAAGAIAFHAAALGSNGRIVAIAGPKKAGKTSLLLHLLRVTGASFVASDRLCLVHGRCGMEARGLPTLIKIRGGSIELFPEAFESLENRPRLLCLTRDERAQPDHPAYASPLNEEPRRILNPGQLTEVLGVGRLGHGALAAVIFPRVEAERAVPLTLSRLAPDAAFEAYEASLFRAGQPWLSQSVLLDETSQIRAENAGLDRFGRQLTATVPCYQCVLGAGAFDETAPPSIVTNLFATADRQAAAGSA